MLLGSFLIGLREGLEAALIIGILIAYLTRRHRRDVLPRLWWGVAAAIALSVALGAGFTFGTYTLSDDAQEIVAGLMSLAAVAVVTWMVFWMMATGHRIKAELESGAAHALAVGTGSAMAWIAFISVGREGLETTLMLWGWALQPDALLGALAGIGAAAGLGYLAYRGLAKISYATFFQWSGAFLIVVAAGILAYGVHELQEAGLLAGPFSGLPIAPTDLSTGEVLTGLTAGPFWMASFPFGWAFDVRAFIDPSGALAALAKGTIGLAPRMSWLEVIAWVAYLGIVLPLFLRRGRDQRRARRTSTPTLTSAESVPAPAERAA